MVVSGEAIVPSFPKVPYKHTHIIMRIYNPQNQFGENLITSVAVDAIKTTILKGMGMSEADINALVSDGKGGYLGTLAARVEANAESISKLTAGSLEYKTVAYAENVQTAYANATYYNKIILVPASPALTEGVNKYTEYVVVNIGSSDAPSYYAEKLGEIGVDSKAITDEIEAINNKIAGENDTLGTTAQTLVGAINEVKGTADSALQGVSSTAVTGDDTHGVSFSLTENATSHELEGSVGITPAVYTSSTKTWDVDTKLATAGDVKTAISDAISAEDTVVDGKSVAMESMTGDVTTAAKVKVAITGTIGEHSIAVTTNDIASAADLTALDTYVKGEADEDGKGGIEKRLEAVETSIGSGTEGIGARVTTLEEALGEGFCSGEGKSVADRMEAVEGVAGTAVQSVSGDTTKSVQVAFEGTTELTTTVTITEAATTGSGNDVTIDLGTDGANNSALVTSKVASDAIAAAEARAKAAQTYTADEVTVHVADNQFSAKTGAVAADATTLTTGGQVHTAIEAAKTALIGTGAEDDDDTIKKAQATAEAAQTAADNEKTARQTDVGAILAGTKHAVGTVVVCSVTAKADTAGTFTVTKPTGVSSVHIMRVEWNHEDFVCKHNGEDIILWDSTTDTTGITMPAASEIQVFALVTGTTAKAEGVTA